MRFVRRNPFRIGYLYVVDHAIMHLYLEPMHLKLYDRLLLYANLHDLHGDRRSFLQTLAAGTDSYICSVVHRDDHYQYSLCSDKVDGRIMRPSWVHKSSFLLATFNFDEMGEDRDGATPLSPSKLPTLDAACEASREAFRLAWSFAAAYEDFIEPGPNRGRPARG